MKELYDFMWHLPDKKFLRLFAGNLLRLVIFAAIVYYLYQHVRFGELLQAITRFHSGWILLGGLLFFGKFFLYGYRWSLIPTMYDIYLPLRFYIHASFEILFLELALPIPDSEDFFRAAKMSRKGISATYATWTIVLDRILGVSILLLILPFSILYFYNQFFEGQQWLTYLVITGSLLVLGCFLLYRKVLKLLVAILQRWEIKWLPQRFLHRLEEIANTRIPILLILRGLGITAVYNALSALVIFILLHSADATIPFYYLLISLPLFYFSGVLPLSVQGIGLFEAAMVFVLPVFGVAGDITRAVALLHFTFHLLLILSGGIVFLVSNLRGEEPISTYYKLFREKLVNTNSVAAKD